MDLAAWNMAIYEARTEELKASLFIAFSASLIHSAAFFIELNNAVLEGGTLRSNFLSMQSL